MPKRKKVVRRKRRYGGERENDIAARLKAGPGENNLNAIKHMESMVPHYAVPSVHRVQPLPVARPQLPRHQMQTMPAQGSRSFLQKAHDFVKKHKLISRGTAFVGLHGVSRAAAQAGYGRRKVGRPRKPGRPRKK